jgi:hypothetical protein
MTYSLNLANVIPATSAFTAMVNAISRPVNTVTISGTKVSLVLNGPVVAGDVVTIAYTKPTINQLQTSTGVMAESSTVMPVTNKVAVIPPPEVPAEVPGINNITISPNPARENITILNSEPNQVAQVVKIFKLTGELCIETSLAPGNNGLISINLNAGMYIVHVISGAVTQSVQKLVILE